jgi:hypothetical protein
MSDTNKPLYRFTNTSPVPVSIGRLFILGESSIEVSEEDLKLWGEGSAPDGLAKVGKLIDSGMIKIEAIPAKPKIGSFEKFTMPIIRPKSKKPETGKPRPDLGERELDI